MQCEHEFSRGKQAGEKCKNKANFGGFCSRHKKTDERPDMSHDEVFGDSPAPKKEKSPPKIKHSVFKWTINSNQDIRTMSAENKRKFKVLIEMVFEPERVARYLVDKTNEDSAENIKELESSFYFEAGDKFGRLHAHGYLKIAHTGFYHFKTAEFRNLAEKTFGSKMHVNVIGASDAEASWRQYIAKKSASSVVEL